MKPPREPGRVWLLLLPELRRIAPAEQAPALQRARETPLDLLELLAMAAGLVVVTALTRHALDLSTMSSRFASTLLNVALALPMLALVLGPFHLRRLRRALRQQRQSSTHDS